MTASKSVVRTFNNLRQGLGPSTDPGHARLAAYIQQHPELLDVAMDIFLNFTPDSWRQSQHISSSLNILAASDPGLCNEYLDHLIDSLESEDLHVSLERNIWRLLQYIDIPAAHSMPIYDLALQTFSNEHIKVAPRAFSLWVATRIACSHPSLIAELRELISYVAELPHSKGLDARMRRCSKILEASDY